MSLHLTRRAIQDIRDIHEFSVSKWGVKVADQYIDAFEETLSLLESYPNVISKKSQISKHFLAYQSGNHLLICDKTDRDVFVLTIQHVSLNLFENLNDLEPTLKSEMEILHREIGKD